MNQIRRWVEKSNSGGGKVPRPSVIRTSNSYDGNDETFSLVALNLLSRYEYFGLTPADAIHSVLATPRERSSFLEALSIRRMHCHQEHHHLSPSTVSLIHTVDASFGKDLLHIVETEGGMADFQQSCPCDMCKGQTCCVSNSMHHQHHGSNPRPGVAISSQQCITAHPSQRRCADVPTLPHRVSMNGKGTSPGKRVRSFFFPTTPLFGVKTGGKVTTRNIDWKLAEAIEQVSSLRLDGMELSSPTPTTESSLASSSSAYEPPCVGIGHTISMF